MRLQYSILYIFVFTTQLFSSYVPITVTPCLQFESTTTLYNSNYTQNYYGKLNINSGDPQPQMGYNAQLDSNGNFYRFWNFTAVEQPTYPYYQYRYTVYEVIPTTGFLDIALKGSKIPTGSNANQNCGWIDTPQCEEPTSTNIGIYQSESDCTTALQTLSNISSSTSLACGCPDLVKLTALHADNLICNSGYFSGLYNSKTFCFSFDGDIDNDGIKNKNDTDIKHSCNQQSNFNTLLSRDTCVGDIIDFDVGVRGVGYYQMCDHTCYILEALAIGCSDLITYKFDKLKKTCDEDLNKLSISCTDYSDNSKPADINSSCIPLNKDIESPCVSVAKKFKSSCNGSNQKVSGGCSDNGITVINNTLTCVNDSNCVGYHEGFDTVTQICTCDSGYTRDSFGECWKDLDNNATQKEKNEDKKKQEDSAKQKDNTDENKKTNDNLGDLKKSLDNQNNALAGIRSDLNISNNLLKKIKDNTNGDSDIIDYEKIITEGNFKVLDIFSRALDGMQQITNDFATMKDKLDTGFTVMASSGANPTFETTVFGKPFKLELCATFSKFYTIGYYIFTFMFLFIGIRIFIYSFMLGV